MNYGYARARRNCENLTVQEEDLRRAGCGHVFSDLVSGGLAERPGLKQALNCLRPGDVLVVRRLDRLGRDLEQLLQVARELERKQAGLIVLIERIDTTVAGGHPLVPLLAALAGFERRSTRR